MADFYQELDQRLFIVDEGSYGYAYDPESTSAVWTALVASFPHVIPINIVTDSFDYDLPKRLKEKIYAIGGGRHPSMIVDTIQDPIDVSFDTKMQHPVFMSYAIGTETSVAGAVAEIATVTPVQKSDCVQDSYFLLNDLVSGSGEKHYAIWIDVSGAGSKPTIAGIHANNVLQVDLNLDASDQDVSDRMVIAINTTTSITADNSAGTVVPITCTNDAAGAVRDVRDSGVTPTLFTFAVATQGTTTHSVAENITHTLPSFTFHVEQYNRNVAAESIYLDLFGCVVTDNEISIDFDEKIIKESVTFRSPHYSVGVLLTNPPRFIENIEPFIWGAFTEAASNYLLMEGTTDKTPDIVSKTSLKVTNDITFLPGIGINYASTVINKKREVSLNIVGFTQNRDTYDYWKDTWDNVNEYYDTASGKLNTVFKVVRTATNDQFEIHVYNWLIEEHNHNVFNIDEGIKGLDITLTEATPYSDTRILVKANGTVGFVITDYLSDTCYQNSFS